jgi:hypothetical protein
MGDGLPGIPHFRHRSAGAPGLDFETWETAKDTSPLRRWSSRHSPLPPLNRNHLEMRVPQVSILRPGRRPIDNVTPWGVVFPGSPTSATEMRVPQVSILRPGRRPIDNSLPPPPGMTPRRRPGSRSPPLSRRIPPSFLIRKQLRPHFSASLASAVGIFPLSTDFPIVFVLAHQMTRKIVCINRHACLYWQPEKLLGRQCGVLSARTQT